MKFRAVFLLGLLVTASVPSANPVPMIVVPSEFVPLGKTAMYKCVPDGQFIQWLVEVPGTALIALVPGGNAMIAAILSSRGIFMDAASPVILSINASSLNNGTVIQCTSVTGDAAILSPSVVINVFGPPDPPSIVDVKPIGTDDWLLSWKATFSFPGVNTTYAILVSDMEAPSGENDLAVGPIVETCFIYHIPKRLPLCSQWYKISVRAKNDAGSGNFSQPIVINAARAVPQPETLRGEVVSAAENGVTLNLSCFISIKCGFPVEGYYVTVGNDINPNESVMKQIRPHNNSTSASYFEVALTSSDGLQPNMKYTCSLLAYNTFGTSTPSSVVIYTTDVQSSTITASYHTLEVSCAFAEGTLAKGCAVCLERSGDAVCQMISRVNGTARGVIRTELSVDCYNISVVDWEKDGSIGSLSTPINISFLSSDIISECNETSAVTAQSKLLPRVFVGIVSGTILFTVTAVAISVLTKERKLLIYHKKSSNLQRPFITNVPKESLQV